LAATFRSLRHRNYRLYFFGQLISLMGTWMQTTALTWLAFHLTQKSTWPAIIVAAQVLPTLFFGALGGAVADQWPKRTLIFFTQAVYLVLALILAGLVHFNTLAPGQPPWQLLVVTVASGLVQAIDLPVRLAYMMDLVGRDDLMNAVALNSVQFNVARVLGPAVAGIILFAWGSEPCFLANALSYLAVLWALAAMDVAVPERRAPTGQPGQSLLAGFHYLAGRRELAFLVLLASTTSFCGWPFLSLLPALSQNRLGAQESGYSLMLSGTGLGALAAAGAVATFGSLERSRLLIGAGVVVVCLGLACLALAPSLAAAAGCCALIGFGLILFLATTQSVVQLGARDHNRGRVMGIWAMTQSGAVPLGNLFFGPLADKLGITTALTFESLACAAAALGLLGFFYFPSSHSS
jgi:MFS family permease